MADTSGEELRCPACGARVFAARPGLAVCNRCDALLGIRGATTSAAKSEEPSAPSAPMPSSLVASARSVPATGVEITERPGGLVLTWKPATPMMPWWVLLPVAFSWCWLPYSMVLLFVPIVLAVVVRRSTELRLEPDRLVAHLGWKVKLVMERSALGDVQVLAMPARRNARDAWHLQVWDEGRQRWVSLGSTRDDRAAHAVVEALAKWRDGRTTR